MPSIERKLVFDEAHSGVLGAHLREAKIHGQLAKHYWWPRMRADITTWCHECQICAAYHVGHPVKPPLTPVPVAGPFDRVGVDFIKFPKSKKGNQYAIVFVDYLTKWPEVFPTKDQSSFTIAKLLVEHIVTRHGVPGELLSDRGKAFLSKLMYEVYELLGIKKVNTTAYHPQTDGLVERFNRTLTSMLAKTVQKQGRDWDEHLPYVLYAYSTNVQESTKESPFFLLYGRDAQLPTEKIINAPVFRETTNLDDYRTEMSQRMAQAWDCAREQIIKAQKKQKQQHDRHAKDPSFQVGERVFVYMPAAGQGEAYKFAKKFQGPFRIITMYDNGVELKDINRSKHIRVALNRVRRCPKEMKDVTEEIRDVEVSEEIPKDDEESESTISDVADSNEQNLVGFENVQDSPWKGRLRSR